jgi:hypothetical protein
MFLHQVLLNQFRKNKKKTFFKFNLLKYIFSTPTMAGGLYAIDRLYFERLGMYDEGIKIWGGENL